MIKVLIVDDNEFRRNALVLNITNSFCEDAVCDSADCIVSAKDRLKDYYDILIVDVNLPYRPDGDPSDNHSLDLLYELTERETLMRSPGQIIGVTAFDSSFSSAKCEFSKYLRTLILWRPESSDGMESIINVIRYALKSKQSNGNDYEYDLCILTALIEESRFVENIDWGWSPSKPLDESLHYKEGCFQSGGVDYKVVHVTAQKMGLVNTALRAARVISAFKPRFISMCGVCGGFERSGVQVGDLIFAENSWELFSGKYDESCGVLPRQDNYQRGVPTWLIENFRTCVEKMPSDLVLSDLNVHSGSIACSSAVIANKQIVEDIFRVANRKALGVEMEIFSLYSAALDAGFPRPTPIAIKGVSDLADAKKTDSDRDLPAKNSALMIKYFFEQRMKDIALLAGSS